MEEAKQSPRHEEKMVWAGWQGNIACDLDNLYVDINLGAWG